MANTRLIIYAGLASALLNPALMFAPIMVGGAVASLGFQADQAVRLISAELAATALASLPACWWVMRLNWRKVAIPALVAVFFGNLLCIWFSSLQALLLIRIVVGFFEGTLLALLLAVIARTDVPESGYAGKLAVQMAAAALGLAVFPLALEVWGFQAIYAILAGAVLLLLAGVGNIPAVQGTCAIRAGGWLPDKPLSYIGLLMLVAFGAGINSLWAYLERIGAAAGFTLRSTGWILASSLLLTILTGILCAAAALRFGRQWPVYIGLLLGSCGALLAVLGFLAKTLFVLSVCLIAIARVLPVPYLFGSVAALDDRGRVAVLMHIAMAMGMAAGPAVASIAYGWVGGYIPVAVTGIGFFAVTWLLFSAMPVTKSTR